MKKIITCLILSAMGTLPALAFERGSNRPPAPPPPEEVASLVIEDFDIDASLGVDAEELTAALAFLHEHRPPPPPDAPQAPARIEPTLEQHARLAADLIREFDKDQDGQLNPPELEVALEALHERHAPPRLPRENH